MHLLEHRYNLQVNLVKFLHLQKNVEYRINEIKTAHLLFENSKFKQLRMFVNV